MWPGTVTNHNTMEWKKPKWRKNSRGSGHFPLKYMYTLYAGKVLDSLYTLRIDKYCLNDALTHFFPLLVHVPYRYCKYIQKYAAFFVASFSISVFLSTLSVIMSCIFLLQMDSIKHICRAFAFFPSKITISPIFNSFFFQTLSHLCCRYPLSLSLSWLLCMMHFSSKYFIICSFERSS